MVHKVYLVVRSSQSWIIKGKQINHNLRHDKSKWRSLIYKLLSSVLKIMLPMFFLSSNYTTTMTTDSLSSCKTTSGFLTMDLVLGPPGFTKVYYLIRKTCPCNVYPLEPHFYIAKLGYARVYLFFLFLLQNIDCGYSLEPPRRGGSNVYPQSMFWSKNKKNIKHFQLKNFNF